MSRLLPYENDKLPMDYSPQIIERIPQLVDPATGYPTQEFQEFYDTLCESILDNDILSLYEISDKVLAKTEFIKLYSWAIGNPLIKIFQYAKSENRSAIDIEINFDRFKDLTRNLIGGFNISGYWLDIDDNLVSNMTRPKLNKLRGEILFTYRDGKFMIISSLQPIIFTDDNM